MYIKDVCTSIRLPKTRHFDPFLHQSTRSKLRFQLNDSNAQDRGHKAYFLSGGSIEDKYTKTIMSGQFELYFGNFDLEEMHIDDRFSYEIIFL